MQVSATRHQGSLVVDPGRAGRGPASSVEGCRWCYATTPVYGWGGAAGRKQLSTAGWLAALPVFEHLGCHIEDCAPDFRGASEIFKTLRASKFAVERYEELQLHRDRIKRTIIGNAEADHMMIMMSDLPGRSPSIGERIGDVTDAIIRPFRLGN